MSAIDQENGIMRRENFSIITKFLLVLSFLFSTNISVINAQSCPDDILSNGKFFFGKARFQDAIATFRSVTLMFPNSEAAEESLYMMIASYRQLADRRRNAQWLRRAREQIRIYKGRYPEGRFSEEVQAESDGVENIETQLTGMSKGLFIALTSIAVGSVVVLGVFIGL